MPRVVMKGLIPTSVMIRPLIAPTSVPVASPMPTARGRANPAAANTAVTNPASASVEPTERSKAPATRRRVMPTAMMLWSESERSTAEMLSPFRNSGAA